jgi:endonuclease/exonuclease/phosphatase family metal-dependent hydrolase
MTNSIKVVSFNIEFCASVTRGYWQYLEFIWKYFLPHNREAIYEVVDVINDEKIDIATFTEMEGESYRTHHTSYINTVSDMTQLKNKIFFPVNQLLRIGNRGNGIATRYEILSSENIKLKTSMENRYLGVSKVDINGIIITVLTTQLALGKVSRANELSQIAEFINNVQGPIIFTGDLNTQMEEELKIIEHTRLRRIETTNTFPSWKPKRRIDYIFYSPDFEVVESYVEDKLKVSDHLPVIAEFRLEKKYTKRIYGRNVSKKIRKR